MRRIRGLAVALALTVLAGCAGGCASSSQDATTSAAARRASQAIVAICRAADPAAARAAGGAGAVERDVGILVAEARARHDPAIVRQAVVALRTSKHTTACSPGFASTIELGLLPRTPRQKIEGGAVSEGLNGFRRGAVGYYATHFGSGEDVAGRECVTTSAGLFEHVPELENLLYLLTTGNAQARQLLAHLRADCRAEGR
jgi:hypothetical protein